MSVLIKNWDLVLAVTGNSSKVDVIIDISLGNSEMERVEKS